MTEVNASELGRIEMFIIAVDNGAWSGLYRAALGFAIIPVLSYSWSAASSGWQLAMAVIMILFLLRVVPAVIRHLGPFSDGVRVIWFERRQLGKRYDSYQWRKLFWIGVGLGCYTWISGQFLLSRIVISSMLLLAGMLGLVRWRMIGAARISPAAALTQGRR